MPDCVGGADRPAGITGRCLQIAFGETRSLFNLAVSNRIVGATAGERDGGVSIATLQGIQQMKKAVLVNGLGGKRQIAVTILNRRIGLRAGPSASMSACENNGPQTGSPPCHSYAISS